MSIIAFSRLIGPVPIEVVMREKHQSSLTITKVPVEVGADMTDHAYVNPATLSLEVADAGAAATWAALERFQSSRVPFTIVTGLKVYRNMLISNIEADRDATHSRILNGKVDLDEVLIANTAVEADPSGGTRSSSTAGGATSGQQGGANSTRAATPTPSTTTGAATQARASGTVNRGPVVTQPVAAATPKRHSILSKLVN